MKLKTILLDAKKAAGAALTGAAAAVAAGLIDDALAAEITGVAGVVTVVVVYLLANETTAPAVADTGPGQIDPTPPAAA